ncbi:RNA polymerase II transcription factor SIII subunit A domain-containing protein [Trichoderma novae-zelandiae]
MSFVKSLRELAIMACFKNVCDIDNIGFLSYETVRDLLARVETAAQLRQIELNSPHLEGQTAELWVRLIERDFPVESKLMGYRPKDPAKWYKIWDRYKVEQTQALKESRNRLKAALAGLQEEQDKKSSKIIELAAVPSSKKGAIRRAHGPRETSSSALLFGGGSRTKTVTGASVMRKVRREVKEIAKIHGNLSRPIRAPSARPTVAKAPEAMINDRKRAAQPAYRPALQEPATASPLEAALADFERRATFLSDSEESGDDAKPKQPANAAPRPAAAKPAAAKPAPKAPTSSLQRKFGGSKPSFKAPPAPSAPVRSAPAPSAPVRSAPVPSAPVPSAPVSSAPVTKTQEPERKRELTPLWDFKRIPRAIPYPTPPLPKVPTSSPMDEASAPQSPEEILAAADERAAIATAAIPPRKRKAVDIFMHPKKRVH